MLERRVHSLLEKPIVSLIRSAQSGDNIGPVPFPGGEPSFFLPLNDKGNGEVNLEPTIGTGPATYTRATDATTVLSTGLIGSVASGVARSWYWPDTLVYGGYLAEPARTNLLLRSEEFDNASWTKTDTTITANNIAAPDGATTADLLTEGTAGTAQTLQTVTATADVVHTTSRFVKYGNNAWMRLRLSSGANSVSGFFNIQTGAVGTSAVTGTGVFSSSAITAYPNGWYRITLSGNLASGATSIDVTTNSATADGNATRVNNATRYEWGAQFENNASYATSYIPTTTASVTRNADVLTYVFAGNADATQGTAYAELGTEWTTATGNFAISFNSFPRLGSNSTEAATTIRASDGTTGLAKSGLTSMATASRKRAGSWGSGGQSVTGDGAAPATAVFDGDAESASVGIGNNAGGTNNWFGPIKNVKIWKIQVADQTLQLMTRTP